MKRIIFLTLAAFISNALIAQNRNPAVWAGTVSPAPMVTGFGNCQFYTGNLGNDPLNGFAGQPMRLKITLSLGVPNNQNPLLAISGTYSSKFNWTYDASINEFTGTQNQVINGNDGGTISISYKATISSSSPAAPQNGFNVNVIPPAYTGGQPTGDDNVSSYTYATAPGPLPVKLAAFNAVVSHCVTTLNWKSSTEVNFDKYIIEYSQDGTNFSQVTTVAGKGDNSSYSATHRPAQGKAFYRLKMLDIDARMEYSRTVALSINCSKGTVMVYPNPASDVLNVNITGADSKGTRAVLYNPSGQAVLSMNLNNGSNTIDISRLAHGYYRIRLDNNNGTETISVIIE